MLLLRIISVFHIFRTILFIVFFYNSMNFIVYFNMKS